jgi:dehydrogenase/reductase SDR family member 7B
LPLDLTDLNAIPDKVKVVLDTFGHIDILINNGGISMRADAINTSIDVDIKIMLVNYFGTVAMTKAVLPSMIQRKEGRIVCVGSAQGKFAIPQRSAYGASKHALQVSSFDVTFHVVHELFFSLSATLFEPKCVKTTSKSR